MAIALGLLGNVGRCEAQEATPKATLEGHVDGVATAWIDAEARRALTGSLDQTIRLWQLEQGQMVREYSLHTGPVHALAVNRDESSFVTGSQDNTVRVWRLPPVTPLQQLESRPGKIRSLSASTLGDILVAVGSGPGIEVIDLADPALPVVTRIEEAEIVHDHVAVRPDGAFFATADQKGRIRLWSPFVETPLAEWIGHEAPIVGIGFSSTGQQLISLDDSGRVCVWQASPAPSVPLDATAIDTIFASPAESGAAVIGLLRSGQWRLWSPTAQTPPRDIVLSKGMIGRAAYLDATKTAAVVLDGNRIEMIDVTQGMVAGSLLTSSTKFLDLNLAGTAGKLHSLSEDGALRVWGKPVPPKPLAPHAAAITAIDASDDGQFLWILDAAGGMTLRSASDDQARPPYAPTVAATCRALHPAGSSAAIGAADGRIHWWNPAAPDQRGSFKAHEGSVTCLAFHAPSNGLVSCGEDGTIRRWNLPLVDDSATPTEPPQPAWAHTFEPKRIGQRVAVDPATGAWALVTRDATTVDRWNADFTPGAPWQGAPDAIDELRLSRDGKVLVATTRGGKVVVWQEGAAVSPALHNRPAPNGAWSLAPNGRRIAWSVGNDVRITDSLLGVECETIVGTAPAAIAWLNDSKRLVRSSGGTLEAIESVCESLWPTNTNARCLAIVADGSRAIIGAADGQVTRLNLADGVIEPWIAADAKPIDWLELSPDGQRLLGTASSGSIRCWTVADGKSVWTGEVSPIASPPAFSSDSTTLFVNTAEAVRVHSMVDGRWLQSLMTPGGSNDVTTTSELKRCVTVGAMGPSFRSVSIERTLQLKRSLPGEAGMVASRLTSMVLTGGGAQALIGAQDGATELVDLTSGETVRRFQDQVMGEIASGMVTTPVASANTPPPAAQPVAVAGESITALAVQTDNQRIATADAAGVVRVWNINDGSVIYRVVAEAAVSALAFSPDDTRLAMLDQAGKLRIWGPGPPPAPATDRVEHQVTLVGTNKSAIRWNRTGDAVWCGGEGPLERWAHVPPVPLRQFNHGGAVLDVAITRDGNKVISCSVDQTVRIWDVVSGQQRAQLQGHVGPVLGLDLSQDETRAVSCGSDGTIRLWDVAGGRPLKQLVRGEITLYDVAFDPTATKIVGAGSDRNVHVYSVADGRELLSLTGHGDFIHSVTFSPDGRRMASFGYAGELKIWDSQAGTLLWEAQVGNAGNKVVYSAGGTCVILAGGDKIARVVEIPAQAR